MTCVKFNNKKLKFIIGDIRDQKSIQQAVIGTDYIFRCCIKTSPFMRILPNGSCKTNIIGVDNLLNEAIKFKKKIICLSTDKAVYPINAMGASKSMMEKVIVANQEFLIQLIFVLLDMEM